MGISARLQKLSSIDRKPFLVGRGPLLNMAPFLNLLSIRPPLDACILRQHRSIDKDILYDSSNGSRKSFRIVAEFVRVQKLQLKLIDGSRKPFLSTEINPIEEGFLWFGDAVLVIASRPLFASPIEFSRDFPVHNID